MDLPPSLLWLAADDDRKSGRLARSSVRKVSGQRNAAKLKERREQGKHPGRPLQLVVSVTASLSRSSAGWLATSGERIDGCMDQAEEIDRGRPVGSCRGRRTAVGKTKVRRRICAIDFFRKRL